eukprot:scaffold15611_cov110-Isochrysis_galbana.AAC.3
MHARMHMHPCHVRSFGTKIGQKLPCASPAAYRACPAIPQSVRPSIRSSPRNGGPPLSEASTELPLPSTTIEPPPTPRLDAAPRPSGLSPSIAWPLAPAVAAATEPPVAVGAPGRIAGSDSVACFCTLAARAKTELMRRGGTRRPAAAASSSASAACPPSSASWCGRKPASLRMRGPSGKMRTHSATAASVAPCRAARCTGRLPAASRWEARSGRQRISAICCSSRCAAGALLDSPDLPDAPIASAGAAAAGAIVESVPAAAGEAAASEPHWQGMAALWAFGVGRGLAVKAECRSLEWRFRMPSRTAAMPRCPSRRATSRGVRPVLPWAGPRNERVEARGGGPTGLVRQQSIGAWR